MWPAVLALYILRGHTIQFQPTPLCYSFTLSIYRDLQDLLCLGGVYICTSGTKLQEIVYNLQDLLCRNN